MQALQQQPTSTTEAERSATERWVPGVMDMVKIDPGNFKSAMFMSSGPRKEFVQGPRIPDDQKPQKRTADGVPVWSVRLAVINWRDQTELVGVTVPMHDDPASKFVTGQPVDLRGAVFGVTPKRDGSGFTTWVSADAIEPQGNRGKQGQAEG